MRVAFAQTATDRLERYTGTGEGWPAETQLWVAGPWTRRLRKGELNGALIGLWVG